MSETPVFDDPEIEAMHRISEALKDLDGAAQGRILRWAADKFVGCDLIAAEELERLEAIEGP